MDHSNQMIQLYSRANPEETIIHVVMFLSMKYGIIWTYPWSCCCFSSRDTMIQGTTWKFNVTYWRVKGSVSDHLNSQILRITHLNVGKTCLPSPMARSMFVGDITGIHIILYLVVSDGLSLPTPCHSGKLYIHMYIYIIIYIRGFPEMGVS